MILSVQGEKLLKDFESLRLTAYPDPGSADGTPWTVGWGATRYEDGSPVLKGDVITRARADELLLHHVARAEREVARAVTAPLTQNQYDALVSFEYNTGGLILKDGSPSQLLVKLNGKDYAGAAAELDKWIYNDGALLSGLVKRRRAERRLFESHVAPPAGTVAGNSPAPAGGKVDPFAITALTALAQLIPTLGKLFKGESPSRVADRNLEAVQAIADKVIPIVVNAAGAPNAQAAVEAIKADSAVARQVEEEVRLNYAELNEMAERSFKAARDFNIEIARAGLKPWELPAFWVTAALLVPVYVVVFRVMFGPFSENLQLQVITAVLAIIVLVGGFWLGSSRDSQRKTELMAGERTNG